MNLSRPSKSSYTEIEAAVEIGVSVDELRSLINTHVISRDEEGETQASRFQIGDLVLLKVLARQRQQAAA